MRSEFLKKLKWTHMTRLGTCRYFKFLIIKTALLLLFIKSTRLGVGYFNRPGPEAALFSVR